MAELEIHHEVAHEHDSFGQKIGIIAAVIGVLLAFDTIASHRAHTEAVVKKTEANDEWAYYQAKSIKRVQYIVAADLAKLNTSSAGNLEASTLEKFAKERDRYLSESEESKKKAEQTEVETKVIEARALRYDFGEGLLELGLVLCSLYFISKKRLFPYIGASSAIAGALIGATAFFVH